MPGLSDHHIVVCGMDSDRLTMGTRMNATPEESNKACYTDSPLISGQARANRLLLRNILTSAELVNFPCEWWHWSFGDRYWAHISGAEAAYYGPIDAP